MFASRHDPSEDVYACSHYVGMHNNTCQWHNDKATSPFYFTMPYMLQVIAKNRLDTVPSRKYKVDTRNIGMWHFAVVYVLGECLLQPVYSNYRLLQISAVNVVNLLKLIAQLHCAYFFLSELYKTIFFLIFSVI